VYCTKSSSGFREKLLSPLIASLFFLLVVHLALLHHFRIATHIFYIGRKYFISPSTVLLADFI
jgi:hypothetical protein